MLRNACILSLFAILILAVRTAAQPHTVQPEQADSLLQIRPKPLILFISADWCRYCSLMEHTTLKDPALTKFMNRYFYFIRLNAGEKKSIRFLGRSFRYQPTGVGSGGHELITFLFRETRVSYPALIFLSPDGEILFRVASFIRSEDLLKLLSILQKNRKD